MVGQTVAPIVNKFIGMMSKALSSLIAFGEAPVVYENFRVRSRYSRYYASRGQYRTSVSRCVYWSTSCNRKSTRALVKYAVTQGGLNASMLTE